MSQTEQEREVFKREFAPCFKIKRAVCEIAGCDGKDVVVDKKEKEVSFRNVYDLKLIAKVYSKSNVMWGAGVSEDIKERATSLLETL